MVSASIKVLEHIQAQVNQLAQIAEQSDVELMATITAQAVHLQKLTKLVLEIHKQVFPEQYDQEGKPIENQPAPNKDNQAHPNLIILK